MNVTGMNRGWRQDEAGRRTIVGVDLGAVKKPHANTSRGQRPPLLEGFRRFRWPVYRKRLHRGLRPLPPRGPGGVPYTLEMLRWFSWIRIKNPGGEIASGVKSMVGDAGFEPATSGM